MDPCDCFLGALHSCHGLVDSIVVYWGGIPYRSRLTVLVLTVQLLDCSHNVMFLLTASNVYILQPTNLISPKVMLFFHMTRDAY